jgi:hypothetical protein
MLRAIRELLHLIPVGVQTTLLDFFVAFGLIGLIAFGAGIAYGYSTRKRGAEESGRSVAARLLESIFDIALAAVIVAPISCGIALIYWSTPRAVFDTSLDLTIRDLMSAMGALLAMIALGAGYIWVIGSATAEIVDIMRGE